MTTGALKQTDAPSASITVNNGIRNDMAQTGREMAPDVDQLNERIRMLEERVSALEDGAGKQRTLAPSLIAETPPSLRPPETGQGFPPIEIPSVVSTIGKAVL